MPAIGRLDSRSNGAPGPDVIFPASAIHAPSAQWAGVLRRRALRPVPPVDLQSLLTAFREQSDFYRQRLAVAGSWSAVPPLEKSDVSKVPVANDFRVKEARTSGTTGMQLSIWNTSPEREFRRALLYRPQLFYDLPETVTQLVFVDGDACARPEDRPKRFYYGGRHYATWFAGAAGNVDAIRHLLLTLRPKLIRGISSGIVRFLMEAGESFRNLGVSIVGPGGEYLQPEWRQMMADAFAARVLDRYGSTETGAIAWQCPYCDDYHANVDEIHLETSPEGLLATPLFVNSQPLLRYRLGDSIGFEVSGQVCQVRLPTVRILEARRDDWIIGRDGQRVSPLSFQFEKLPGLQYWRLHQLGTGDLRLYFDASTPETTGPELASALATVVPGRKIDLVQGVWKLKRGGKFKRVVSDYSGA